MPAACSDCDEPAYATYVRCLGPACGYCDRCYGCWQIVCETCNTPPVPPFRFEGDREPHPHNVI